MRPFSSQWITTKLTSSPTFSYSTSPSASIPPTFFGVTFDRTLPFSKHVSLLKAKSFPRLKALRCISGVSWGPSRIPFLFYIKVYLGSFSLMLQPHGFLSRTLPSWNAFTERLVAPSPAASRPSLYHFFSLRFFYFPYKPPRLISFCHLMSGLFFPNLLFYFCFGQTWSEAKTLQIPLESVCVHFASHSFLCIS